eukprot:SAG31_NODE_218_length_19934_cov_81.634837_7_plen_620_part_00
MCRTPPPAEVLLTRTDVLADALEWQRGAQAREDADIACSATLVCDGQWAVKFAAVSDGSCSTPTGVLLILHYVYTSQLGWALQRSHEADSGTTPLLGDGPCSSTPLTSTVALQLVPDEIITPSETLSPVAAQPACDGAWTITYAGPTEIRLREALFIKQEGSWILMEFSARTDRVNDAEACLDTVDGATVCTAVNGDRGLWNDVARHGAAWYFDTMATSLTAEGPMSVGACLAAVRTTFPHASGLEIDQEGICKPTYGEVHVYPTREPINYYDLFGWPYSRRAFTETAGKKCAFVPTSNCRGPADGICPTTAPSYCFQTNEIDRNVVVQLRDAHGIFSRESVGDPCGRRWDGVHCDDAGRIRHVQMGQLDGKLPQLITNLTSLHVLSVVPPVYNIDVYNIESANGTSGTLPDGIFSMPNLKRLSIYAKISGTLPDPIHCSSTLLQLAIQSGADYSSMAVAEAEVGAISGTIPESWEGCSEIRDFYFENSMVSGTLPAGLSRMSSIQTLFLSRNRFLQRGGIPTAWFGSMPHLRQLVIEESNVGGYLPELASEYPFPLLRRLEADSASLSGTLPNRLMDTRCDLESLRCHIHLELGDNQLSGTLPPAWGELDFTVTDQHG